MLVPFIKKVNNVPGDGHCAYHSASRCLSRALGVPGQGEEFLHKLAWFQVRKAVHHELVTSSEPLWSKFFRDDYEMVKSNVWVESVRSPTGKDKWFDPDFLGYPLANAYSRPVVTLGKYQSTTYLPLRTGPGDLASLAPIVMLFVQGNHWVEVEFMDDAVVPYPPMAGGWARHCEEGAEDWKDQLQENFQLWTDLTKKAKGKKMN